MTLSITKKIAIGVLAEILIFCFVYATQASIEETFRIAARYSGRLSAVVFLFSFFWFAKSPPHLRSANSVWHHSIVVFAVLHLIHFGFLACNVYLNKIPLETVKVFGGALAYAMIVVFPFTWHRLRSTHFIIYYYYVSLVMILTYMARIKGDFEGAEPFWLHHLAIDVFVICAIYFGWLIFNNSSKRIN